MTLPAAVRAAGWRYWAAAAGCSVIAALIVGIPTGLAGRSAMPALGSGTLGWLAIGCPILLALVALVVRVRTVGRACAVPLASA